MGGMGEVWQATDLLLERRVAVKMLRPEHAYDADGQARFRAEAHYAGSLSHPNIAHVYDYCEAEPPDPGYLVTELVEGPSLARLLDEGPLTPARTMDVIAQAARGLAAAHHAGLIHRDIKPGNLLVNPEGLIKITDFGVAHAAGSTVMTQEGVLIGTPAYLAPERAAGDPATPATDLYALGVVAHHCLTGQLPFQGEPLAVVIAHMERGMPPLPDAVPAEVAALVGDLTRKDPRDRPASADEVAARAGQLAAVLSATPLAFPATATTAAAAASVASVAAAAADAAPGPAPDPNRPPTLNMPLPGGRSRGGVRSRAAALSVPARAGVGLAALGAAALVSWMLITLPGSSSANSPSLNPPAGRAGAHTGSGKHPDTAASQAASTGGNDVSPAGHTKTTAPSGPTPSPTASAPASPSPAPSNSPAPTPSPSSSASPGPTPTNGGGPTPEAHSPTLADS